MTATPSGLDQPSHRVHIGILGTVHGVSCAKAARERDPNQTYAPHLVFLGAVRFAPRFTNGGRRLVRRSWRSSRSASRSANGSWAASTDRGCVDVVVGRLGSGPIGVSMKSPWRERGISSAHSVRPRRTSRSGAPIFSARPIRNRARTARAVVQRRKCKRTEARFRGPRPGGTPRHQRSLDRTRRSVVHRLTERRP